MRGNIFIFSVLILLFFKEIHETNIKTAIIFCTFSNTYSSSCGNLHEHVLQRCVRRVKEPTKVLNSATQ